MLSPSFLENFGKEAAIMFAGFRRHAKGESYIVIMDGWLQILPDLFYLFMYSRQSKKDDYDCIEQRRMIE